MFARDGIEDRKELRVVQRPATEVQIWMPRAPRVLMARSISSRAAGTLFIGSEATKAGNCCGHFATIAAMPSLAMRASSGARSGPPSSSGEGSERVSTCRTSGKLLLSISTRFSMSHSNVRPDMRLTMPASRECNFIISRYRTGMTWL